ncbi:carbohydrate ABC transporter permease [Arthrobacter sp. ISL-95]|uniref:carbohydrate ABC transporter permease n=1 Tax=Arthrobacter sp. ISL-95 TaxID=2819116 RepID=UPI001BE7E6B6|nr:sugar ABC transporter permease [Arthrobacter sp. ISL-95]MBT2588361.1 sugar ABC transporter permease [Arthrobacter sp. ISL-95]
MTLTPAKSPTQGTTVTKPDVPRKTQRRKAFDFRRSNTGYVFLTPWMIGVVGLVCLPLLISLYLSFTNYNILGAPKWVGLENYIRLFTQDQRYVHSMLLTLGYVVVSVPLQLVSALAVALMLAPARKGQSLYRALFYLPSLLGASVGISITWRAIFDRDGAVPQFLASFGIPEQSWINNPGTVLWVIIALEIWKFGAPMIIFIAGLHQIPKELYEAASIDGAGPIRKFFTMTLPMLSPVLFFNLVMGVISSFQTFTPAQIVGDGNGGPTDSTLFYAVYMYQQAFQYQKMGYASAIAWIMLIVLGAVAALLFLTSRKWVHYAND